MIICVYSTLLIYASKVKLAPTWKKRERKARDSCVAANLVSRTGRSDIVQLLGIDCKTE